MQEDSYLMKTVLPNVAESLFRGCVVLYAPFRLGQKTRIIFHNTEAIVSEFTGPFTEQEIRKWASFEIKNQYMERPPYIADHYLAEYLKHTI